jgi:NodT family efflux transporter outer membrane factor (OMF) lipoprotein
VPILFPVAALALLCGCAVGPDYERPAATAIPRAYASDTGGWKVAHPQAQLPKGDWWEVFGDPQLNALEVDASASNQQLKAAVQQFAEARAALDFARGGLYPDLTLSGQYTRQSTSPNSPLSTTGLPLGQSSTYNNFAVPLDVSYEFDLWGRVRRSVESAQAQAQASADDLEAVRLAVQAEVASDYFSLRTLDSEQAVLRSSVDVFSKSYGLTVDRRAGGVATDLEVAQAETVLKVTQAQLPEVALARAQFEHALALLSGRTASQFSIPASTSVAAPPTIPAGLPSELLERRPDISAAERRMAAANANIGVAKAAFFPSFQLNGLTGLDSANTGNLLSSSSGLWALGPSLTLPVFEGGRLRAGLSFATAAYIELVASYRQTVLTAYSEVEDSLSAQSLLSSQYEAEQDALLAARKQLDLANIRYRDGLVTYLEVATAESTELNIEFSTVQIRGRQLVAAVNLVKALGGAWQDRIQHQRKGASSSIRQLSREPLVRQRWTTARSTNSKSAAAKSTKTLESETTKKQRNEDTR